MTGALDPAHVEDDLAGVRLRGRGVADDVGVIDRHQGAGLAGCSHLSLREARAADEEPGVAGGAADGRRDRIDHGQNDKTAAELVWHSDDGAAQVVDSDSYGVSDADGKFAAWIELAVDLRVRAVDHLTGLFSDRHLQDREEQCELIQALYKHSLYYQKV